MIAADMNVVLPDDFLTKVDRASMACGLEVRPPLVDHELLELTAQIPSELKVRHGEGKWIFKNVYADRLPPSICRRPKRGFEIPVDQWLRGPLRDVFEDTVLQPGASVGTWVDQSAARHLYQSHLNGVGRNGDVLWSILVLARWCDRYLRSSESETANQQPPVVAIGTNAQLCVALIDQHRKHVNQIEMHRLCHSAD